MTLTRPVGNVNAVVTKDFEILTLRHGVRYPMSGADGSTRQERRINLHKCDCSRLHCIVWRTNIFKRLRDIENDLLRADKSINVSIA